MTGVDVERIEQMSSRVREILLEVLPGDRDRCRIVRQGHHLYRRSARSAARSSSISNPACRESGPGRSGLNG